MLLQELFARQEEERHDEIVDDVAFFIDHEDDLYKEYFLPAVDELKRKKVIERDEIDEIYPEFAGLVNAGCEKYHEKFKPQGKAEEIYTKEFKIAVAKKIAEKHLAHIKDGEYDPKDM